MKMKVVLVLLLYPKYVREKGASRASSYVARIGAPSVPLRIIFRKYRAGTLEIRGWTRGGK